jgi:ubiquinol-cytochrome c reductase cytochrome b subunit
LSPDFSAQPLPSQVVGAASRPIHQGAELFHTKGCEFCHTIAGHGGQRGPDLTDVGERLTPQQLVIRILNGGTNMLAYGSKLTPDQPNALTAFLQLRKVP